MSDVVQAPQPTVEDFLDGFLNLLPTGPVWPKEPREGADQPVLVQTCRGLVQLYPDNATRALNLLTDAFPVAPVELLPEWEDTLGLPGPCAGASPSLQARQQSVAARFVASGGQTVAYYTNVAAALGYTITIQQFTPYRVGEPVGNPLCSEAWASAWQVNGPLLTIDWFEVGRNMVGDPLATWGNTTLQCELNRLKPAHTTLLFNYS